MRAAQIKKLKTVKRRTIMLGFLSGFGEFPGRTFSQKFRVRVARQRHPYVESAPPHGEQVWLDVPEPAEAVLRPVGLTRTMARLLSSSIPASFAEDETRIPYFCSPRTSVSARTQNSTPSPSGRKMRKMLPMRPPRFFSLVSMEGIMWGRGA